MTTEEHLKNLQDLITPLHEYCKKHGLPMVALAGCSRSDYYHASWVGDLANCAPGIVLYVLEEFARARAASQLLEP